MSAAASREVDLTQIPGLDHHRTAVTFNCLILKMTEILNHFGNRMEEVLDRAESSLDTADRKLRLMEAKLSEVHLDEDVQKRATTSSEPIQKVPETPAAPENTNDPDAVQNPDAAQDSKPEDVASTSIPSSSVVLIKDDPAFSKYFKMLKMGVPEAGVIQKMSSEGVDPSLLHRGDEPTRVQKQKTLDYESSGESVSSFSDSD